MRMREAQNRTRAKGRLAAIVLALIAHGLVTSANQAARTPAGTIIRNHAVIQFQHDDASGRIFETPSNEVLIEVLPVYGLEILPDGDAPPGTPGQTQSAVSAVPNARVTFHYTLTFTGNIADNARITPVFNHAESTFLPKLADGDTGVVIYKDCNANGIVDGDDIQVASWRDADSNGEAEPGELQTGDLGCLHQPGEVIDLLLVFHVPAGIAPDGVAYVGVEGTSMGDSSVKDPASAPATQNISKLVVVDDAVMSVTKAVNVIQAAPGGSLTFTVTGNSVGSAPALRRSLTVDGNIDSHRGVVVYDVIPVVAETLEPLAVSNPVIVSEPVGVSGTLIYSDQVNTILDVNDSSWAWHTAYVAGDTVVAYVSSAGGSDYDLAIGASVSFRFDGIVPATAQDQTLTNRAYASYATNALGVQTVKAVNDVAVYVRGATGVLIRDTDFELMPPPLTPDDDDAAGNGNDMQTVQLAQAGTFVYFTNRVLNTGSRSDSFNITLKTIGIAPVTSNPNGWTLSFFKSDGLTPLRDTGVDGIIDTGPVAPAGTDLDNPAGFVDIVVRVEIPEDAESTVNNPEALFVIQAASVSNPTTTDTTVDRIVTVARAEMSLDNHFPVGSQTPDPVPYQQIGDPGSIVVFPLIIRNLAPANGEVDTYTLRTSVLPVDWTVTYYRDLNRNGVHDAAELLPTLRTAALPPGGSDYLIARVAIPVDAVADANHDDVQDVHTIIFRATSTNNTTVFSEQEDMVAVSWRNRFELRPDRQGTIEAGGVTVYPHNLTNYGERGNRFFLTITPGTNGWTYLLLESDGSGQLPKAPDPSDGIEKYWIDLDEAGGPDDASVFLIRLYAPAGVPQGTLDMTTILASANDPAEPTTAFAWSHLHLVTDVTVVIAGDLSLVKSSNPAHGTPVQPGQQIEYTTTFFNRGVAALAELTIQDQIPTHTAYVLQSAAAEIPLPVGLTGVVFQVSRDGGVSWGPDSVGAGPDPTVTNVRMVFSGSLAAGIEGNVTFRVQIR